MLSAAKGLVGIADEYATPGSDLADKLDAITEYAVKYTETAMPYRGFDYMTNDGQRAGGTRPKFGYDRTYQYRLNLYKIKKDLEALGYPLARWNLTDVREEQEDTEDSPIGKIDTLPLKRGQKSSILSELISDGMEVSSLQMEMSSEQYQRVRQRVLQKPCLPTVRLAP